MAYIAAVAVLVIHIEMMQVDNWKPNISLNQYYRYELVNGNFSNDYLPSWACPYKCMNLLAIKKFKLAKPVSSKIRSATRSCKLVISTAIAMMSEPMKIKFVSAKYSYEMSIIIATRNKCVQNKGSYSRYILGRYNSKQRVKHQRH